jgi:cytochrome c553
MFATRVRFLAVGTAVFCQSHGGTGAIADDAKLRAYGAHLSRECTACHRLDGTDNGIPSIIGWDSERFTATLKFYQEGQRSNPAMVSVAKSLDDEQVRALAAYFSSLPPPPKTKSVQPAKVR